ncbi:hypothetical protein AWZ03_010545 [Drosophila navojoa]|uniref:Uncharacterized protein n=1 Tax=Drosophila navojoa TaxID=7232 RepID=A0A484B2N8_DRONA|nr:hypothetical protein AWZ03_010545 [Drosophila navojoa]
MLAIKRCKLGGYPHVPKQPYFKELQFLKDAIEPSVSAQIIESEAQDQINCIVEDAFLLSNSENSIHNDQIDFQIPSSNEYTFTNTELQSHESEPRQLPLPQYDMGATILLPIRCESGCDRWHQASYYEDEDEGYVRRPSGSANPNEQNHNFSYYSRKTADNEYCSRDYNSQWALAYPPQVLTDYGNTLKTNMYAEVTYPRCACAPKKKVLTGRYKPKSKLTDSYYDGEDFKKFVEPNTQSLQFRCSNHANYNTSSDYHHDRCYRNVSRHTSGDEQTTPYNKCVGVNCNINHGTYAPQEVDSAGYGAYPQKDYGAVCGYNRNNRQMSDKANDPLADDEPESFVGICNESNCPKSQFYKQAAKSYENNDYQMKHRPCDDNPDYGDEQYCRNNPEMKDPYNSDNVPAVEENFRGNGNSNLKYEAEENGYERQQENRIDEYTACNSECPVHQESSRYARKYQNEEPEYQNQQAPQVNLYVTCHSECPFRQEDGSRYQDCHSLKYQIEENNYENDQNTRAEEYAASPSNQYQEDYGKTYENFNNQNDANMDCQCEESLLPVNIQSTVEQITDEINVIRYADCIPDECPAYQANIENPVDEMLDCECPTDEEELQKPKAEQPQQADMFKTNIICQCEAAVETDLDMSLKDRYTPRKESACELPAVLAEKTIDMLSTHIASKAPPDVDVKPAGSRRSLPGEMPPKNGASGTETSNPGCRYRSNPFLKLNYEISKGNIIVWHPPAQGFRASKNSFSMKDCKIDNSQASKLEKSTPSLSTK